MCVAQQAQVYEYGICNTAKMEGLRSRSNCAEHGRHAVALSLEEHGTQAQADTDPHVPTVHKVVLTRLQELLHDSSTPNGRLCGTLAESRDTATQQQQDHGWTIVDHLTMVQRTRQSIFGHPAMCPHYI